ncbi:SMP-30/gluconolactonase/LRE family protein [Paenibacillus sp. Marseille-Q7038]
MSLKKAVLITGVLVTSFSRYHTIVNSQTGFISLPQDTTERANISTVVKKNAKWEKVVTGKGFIEGINFDNKGQMWLVSPTTGEILKDVNGEATPVGESYGGPNGAKFHENGLLYVADKSGELYTFDTSTGKRDTIVKYFGNEHLRGLNDLIFDKDGGLYVTEPYGSDATNPIGRVFYLSPSKDSKLQLFESNLAYPNGIALSPDESIVYIAEFNKNRIIAAPAINAKDSPLTPHVFAEFEGGIGPDGITVDSEGNVYAKTFPGRRSYCIRFQWV